MDGVAGVPPVLGRTVPWLISVGIFGLPEEVEPDRSSPGRCSFPGPVLEPSSVLSSGSEVSGVSGSG